MKQQMTKSETASRRQSLALARYFRVLPLLACFAAPLQPLTAQDEAPVQPPAAKPRAISMTASRPGVFSTAAADGQVEISASGISLRTAGTVSRSLHLQWAGAGNGQEGIPAARRGTAAPVGREKDVALVRTDGIIESVQVNERGADQAFEIHHAVTRRGEDLVLYQQVETSLAPELGQVRSLGGLTYYEADQPMVHYGPAVARDAAGREIPVEMQQEPGRINLVVDGGWLDDAQYPVRVESPLLLLGDVKFIPPPPPPYYSAPISRVQLKLITAGVSNAGTDDNVLASLSDNNSTYLDYGRDDFESGDVFTYDLSLEGIQTMSDIKRLRISKSGTNGWCIRSLTLFVNGKALYSTDFGLSGRWLDNNNGLDYRILYLDEAEIKRSLSTWGSPMPAQQTSISRSELESRIESMVGDYIAGNDLSWGKIYGRAVEVSPASLSTVHVDLDLILRQALLPDPEVDVDFDIEFQCINNKLAMATKNVKAKVDYPLWFDILTISSTGMPLSQFLGSYLSGEFSKSLSALNFYNTQGQLACPAFSVMGDGSVQLGAPVR
ncbi:MAG: hypothetical protein HY821_18315 [Acidobacteria bacterium]|nr:hypothetical protein [Acidobacteriota bacterium]